MVWLLSSFFLFFSFFYFYFFLFLIIFFYFNNFILFSFFPSFFLLSLLSHVADRVLVLQPGVRPVLLRRESRVQDIGPPETSRLHIISNSESSPRNLQLNANTQLNTNTQLNDQQATVLDTLCQTSSKTGPQPHPLAERLPKIIIRSQTPQNTSLDVVLPTRKTGSSLIHQNTHTSPLCQDAYTTH